MRTISPESPLPDLSNNFSSAHRLNHSIDICESVRRFIIPSSNVPKPKGLQRSKTLYNYIVMKSHLDEIETRLQHWIENSATRLPWMDPALNLTHQLVQAVRNNLSTAPDGRTTAPSQYTIYIHPESTAAWQMDETTLQSLASALQHSAQNSGISFATPPTLHVLSDPQLVPGQMRVQAIENDLSGQTAIMPALPTAPQPAIPLGACLITPDQQTYSLTQPVFNIGRRPDNHLVLPDPRVSRTHIQLRIVRGHYILFDLNSSGGTYINGQRVSQHTLRPGDVISLAGYLLIYSEECTPPA